MKAPDPEQRPMPVSGPGDVHAAEAGTQFLYRRTLDNSPIAFFMESGGKFILVNRAFARLYGAETQKEVIGRSVLEFVHPEERDTVRQRMQAAACAPGDLSVLEYRIQRLDGKCAHIEVSASVFNDLGGAKTQGFVRDISARKKAEEAVLRSDARFQMLFENAPFGISVARGETLLYVNPAYARMFGYASPAELEGTSLMEQIAPSWSGIIRERIERRRRGESVPNDYEVMGRRKDGTEFPYHTKICRIELDEGLATVTFMTDITERKQLEQRNAALLKLGKELGSARSRESAARLLAGVTENLFGWDACALHLYSAESDTSTAVLLVDTIDGKKIEIPSTLDPRPSPLQRRIMQNGAELILRSEKDNDFVAGGVAFGDAGRPSASLMFVPFREGLKVVGFFTIQSYRFNAYSEADLQTLQFISDYCGGALERIRTEDALRASERKFEHLADVSPAGIFQADANGNLFFINKRFSQFSGLTLEQARRFGMAAAVHPDDRERVLQEWSRCVKEHRPFKMEFRFKNGRGSQIWVLGQAVPAEGDSEEVVGYIGTVIDITERKQAELLTVAFAQMARRLSAATSPREAAKSILEIADEMLGWDSCFVNLDGNENEAMLLGFDTVEGERREIPNCRVRAKAILNCHELNQPRLTLRNSETVEDGNAQVFQGQQKAPASLMHAPIRHENQVIGCVSVQSYSTSAYTQRDLKTLQSLADYCGGALIRLRAQEALRRSELQLRLVWQNSMDGMRLMTEDGRIVAVNEAYCRIVHSDPERLVGKSFINVYAPEVREAMLQSKRVLFETSQSPRFHETDLTLHDGRKISAEVFHSLLRIEGQPTLILSVFRDITQRKQIETCNTALTKLTGQLAAASTPPEAAQIICDLTRELFGWDCFRLSLYSSEQDLMTEILAIDTFDGREVPVAADIRGRRPSERTRRIMQKGELILKTPPLVMSSDAVPFGNISQPSASIMGVPIRHGTQVVGVLTIQSYLLNAYSEAQLAFLQTIADQCGGALDRIRVEAALRASEVRFRSVWDKSVDGMRLTDEEGRIIAVNQAFCSLVGMESCDLEGQIFTSTFLPESRHPELLESYKEQFANRSDVKRTVQQLQFRNGKTAELEMTASLIEGEQQKRLMLCLFRDVTEQKQLEEQLRQSQKMESIGKLAGGIAHDFNNLLTVIQGHTALLLSTKDAFSEEVDSLQQIAAAAERSANLTRQLLTYSRRQVMQQTSLNMTEVVNSMTRMLRRILGEDILLLVFHSPTLPMVRADQGMMEQLLMNLCVNARDAMPKGGELIISTNPAVVGEDYVRLHPDASPGKYLSLMVKDSGCGIPADILPHIFEPFFTTKEIGKGTGMGLATVYGIVKQHGGWITVNSPPEEGTCFEVFLPACTEPSKPGEKGGSAPVRGGTETILVVEDETPLRNLVTRVLTRYGYSVLAADSGVAALEVWQRHRKEISLLLTDLIMPHGINGRELALRLRSDNPDLKIVYTSGYSADVIGKGLLLQEGLNFIQKPYPPQKLAQTVRDSLDGKLSS